MRPLLAALVVAGAVAASVALPDAAKPAEHAKPAAAAAAKYDGTVYVESNRRHGRNSVLAFRYRHGSFRAFKVRKYRTGGSGSHDLSNAGVLDAEQQIVTNADRTLLFAPNTGS